MECVSQLNRGIAYAESCFETFRVIDGRVLAYHEHGQRLQQAATCFGWSLDAGALCQQAVVQAGRLCRDALVRITLAGGDAPWGVLPGSSSPDVYVQVLPTPPRRSCDLHCVDTQTSLLRPRSHKFAADYATMLMLYHRMRSVLPQHTQPLWCFEDVAISTMTANVVFLIDGQWRTPREQDGILNGIVRSYLLRHGVVTPDACALDDLARCQAAACINSGVLIQPVQSLNGRVLDVAPVVFEDLHRALRHSPEVTPS